MHFKLHTQGQSKHSFVSFDFEFQFLVRVHLATTVWKLLSSIVLGPKSPGFSNFLLLSSSYRECRNISISTHFHKKDLIKYSELSIYKNSDYVYTILEFDYLFKDTYS